MTVMVDQTRLLMAGLWTWQEISSNLETPLVEFDEHGDLKIRVGGAATSEKGTSSKPMRTFQVDSKALSRVSPRFKRMLYGNTEQSKFNQNRDSNGADWTIELAEDDACAFEIILTIVHGDFANVPLTITPPQLYELTVLTDKYDMTSILAPWVDLWIRHIKNHEPWHQQKDEMLWIAWELGQKELFEECAIMLQKETGTRPRQWKGQTPPDIFENIDDSREEAVGEIFQLYSVTIDELQEEGIRYCVVDNFNPTPTRLDRRQCESIMLGSLMLSLKKAHLLPLPDPAQYDGSVTELIATLDALKVFALCDHAPNGYPLDHSPCNPQIELRKKTRQVADRMASPVRDVHLQHLDGQAQKLRRSNRPFLRSRSPAN